MANGDNKGFFWNSENKDRLYDADSFETWLKKFFTTGVFFGDYMVSSSGGMAVNVGTGYANVDGKVLFSGQVTELTLDPPHSVYPRIDTIVIQRDDTERQITIEKVTGAYSGDSPIPTPPVRSGGIFQLVLAQIYVGAGVSGISQANITDKRSDNNVCGFVTGTVKELDWSQITEQFNEFMREYSAEIDSDINQFMQEMLNYQATEKAEFEAWFETIKGQLDTDIAGHLQNEITEIDEKLTLLEHMAIQNDYTAPLATDDSTVTLITDDLGYAILVDWKYEEV